MQSKIMKIITCTI